MAPTTFRCWPNSRCLRPARDTRRLLAFWLAMASASVSSGIVRTASWHDRWNSATGRNDRRFWLSIGMLGRCEEKGHIPHWTPRLCRVGRVGGSGVPRPHSGQQRDGGPTVTPWWALWAWPGARLQVQDARARTWGGGDALASGHVAERVNGFASIASDKTYSPTRELILESFHFDCQESGFGGL